MAHVLSSKTVHSGRVFSVAVDRVRLPNGREATLEVVRHAPAAVLVPMPDEGHVILVRQYRYAIDRAVWELPAGTIEPGESIEDGARRECHEEIGLLPNYVEKLAAFFPTPGYCDEEMVFFRLTGLVAPGTEAARDPDEDIEPAVFSLDEAQAMIRRGEIVDMKTALGLMLVGGSP
jgi:ADP-ribose pyrophosphatase